MDYYTQTDIGKIRAMNQDQTTIAINKYDQLLAVVCDGMGGHRGGEIASRLATDYVVQCFNVVPSFESESEIEHWLRETIYACNDLVKRAAHDNEELYGMGTTIALAIVIGNTAYLSHVGDSRIYLYNDQLTQLTSDHTLVNELVNQGTITKDAALHHAKKNILIQAIGAQNNLAPSYRKVDITDGILMLCSDGLFNLVTDQDIKELLSLTVSAKVRVEKLIELANIRGGNDNITVSIIDNREVKDAK